MKTTSDLVMELLDRDDQASDLEDLVAEIKTIIESPFTLDEYKIANIRKAIEEYGY